MPGEGASRLERRTTKRAALFAGLRRWTRIVKGSGWEKTSEMTFVGSEEKKAQKKKAAALGSWKGLLGGGAKKMEELERTR